jgi:hypothetical protein
MKSLLVAWILPVSFLLLLPAAASAQSSITGVVPGVTVEASGPALIEGSRTAVTDNQGAYRMSICGQACTPCRSRFPDSAH